MPTNCRAPRKPVKLHKCSFCPYFSYKTTNLREHVKTHTKVKPYQCTICGKCFTQKIHCQRHYMTHGKHSYLCWPWLWHLSFGLTFIVDVFYILKDMQYNGNFSVWMFISFSMLNKHKLYYAINILCAIFLFDQKFSYNIYVIFFRVFYYLLLLLDYFCYCMSFIIGIPRKALFFF